MKTLILKLGEKKYSTGKITACMSREALKIQKDAINMAKEAMKLQNQPKDSTDEALMDIAEQLMTLSEELSNRKSQLIVDVYGDKFSIDELEKNLSNEEIDKEINKILNGITGIVSKN